MIRTFVKVSVSVEANTRRLNEVTKNVGVNYQMRLFLVRMQNHI